MANQVSRYEPMGTALSLRDAMDRLFEDSFVWPRAMMARDTNGAWQWTMPLDLYETPEELVLQAALPGIKPEELKIEVQNGILVLDATVQETKRENVTYHYRELSYGHYRRELSLPIAINSDKIEATLQNGYLTLHMPKAEEAKPKKIDVRVK